MNPVQPSVHGLADESPRLAIGHSVKVVRRSRYTFFYFDDGEFLDVDALLAGRARLAHTKQIYAVSILTGETYPITSDELALLGDIPASKWSEVASLVSASNAVSPELIETLARKGLLLTDLADGYLAELNERHDALESNQWNLFAASYYFMSRWQDFRLPINLPDDIEGLADINAASDGVIEEFVDHFGEPPSHFHSITDAVGTYDLPLPAASGGLYDALSIRKTTRAYDSGTPLPIEKLSTVLYYVFGCHGYSVVAPNIVGLKKTSPSGGDLHPVEAYLLVTSVTTLEPGLYHYHVGKHSLELMSPMLQEEARELANEFTAGQSYPRWAHVLIILTARFYRSFWKYRRHQKALAVLFMDVGHLSQSLYLVCADLGLGAFITGAINNVNIEKRLGLDGVREGSLAVCGLGIPTGDGSGVDPTFLSYVPGRTEI